MDKNKKGFTLMEVLLTISIVVVIAGVGAGFYLNYAKNVELKSTANTLVSDLRQAQSKSMTGNGGLKWGVHFVNGDSDYYEIFSTSTDYGDEGKNIIFTRYLEYGIFFVEPSESSTKDVIFNKITGSTTESPIVLRSSDNIIIVNISSVGLISSIL